MATRPRATSSAGTTTASVQTAEDDLYPAAKKGLLDLPLELIGNILDQAFEHPNVSARRASGHATDSRSHGWSASNASLQAMKQYQAAYAGQVLVLMRTCRTFHHHLRPRLYDEPVLLTPEAIRSFYATIKASQTNPHDRLSTLVKKLVLFPSQKSPPGNLIAAWSTYLTKFFRRLPHLETFSPGVYTSFIRLEHVASSLPLLNRLKHLDNLDLFAAFVALNPRQAQDGVLTLLNRAAPRLERISLSTINLLEPGCPLRQKSKFIISANASWPPTTEDSDDDDDEGEEFSPEDSCAPRFCQAIASAKAGIEWEEPGREDGSVETRREKGIESLYFFGDSPIGVGVLAEILINMPNLKCLHLDAFVMLAPSLSETIPFYQRRTGKLSLPNLVDALAHTNTQLAELTFAPLLLGSVLTSGKMDDVLNHLPHLTHLELRADFVSPDFFRHLVGRSRASPLRYLAFHILPPHAPPVFAPASGTLNAASQGTGPGPTANGVAPEYEVEEENEGDDAGFGFAPAAPAVKVAKCVAVTICQFRGHDQIDGLARAVEDVFFSTADEGHGDGVAACEWPRQTQEEFGGDGREREDRFDLPIWYDLLMRLGRMGLEMKANEAEEEGRRCEEEDEDEEEDENDDQV
ncbi:hypothetical protein JCM11491_003920 [Sporobolomyces phaffii]